MRSHARVLVIDDGGLGRVRRVLSEAQVELTHLRGQVIREDLEGSVDLSDLAGKPIGGQESDLP